VKAIVVPSGDHTGHQSCEATMARVLLAPAPASRSAPSEAAATRADSLFIPR